MRALGIALGAVLVITGAVWTWGSDDYVRLDSFVEPVHILSVKADER